MNRIKTNLLQPPEIFDFPFPPYEIQQDFMKNLYNCLETGKLGIFESPTGTGKSLSILCGAIRWLKDYKQNEKEQIISEIAKLEIDKQKNTETSDWLTTQAKVIEITKRLNDLKLRESKINEYERKIDNIKNYKKHNAKNNLTVKKKVVVETSQDSDVEDENIIIEDPEVEQEVESDEEDSVEIYEPLKIYICSRTHSQLAQFIGEIIKSPFGSETRVVSLASRQTYCINPKVRKLKSMALINERCLDLQKKSYKPSKTDEDGKVTKKKVKDFTSCTYLKQSVIEELRNESLLNVQDVEDLVKVGKDLGACPYYASRKASEDAEIVLIPYNTLLHKATREANGIKIKNNVVIIDEAHNLLESLAQMYGSDLYYNQIYHSLNQLRQYKNKFNKRFSAKNLLLINQLIFVVSQLEAFMSEGSKENSMKIFTLENFVLSAKIDNYNMFKIVQFSKQTRIAQKVRSYSVKYPSNQSVAEDQKGVKHFLAKINSEKNQITQDETIENNPKENDTKVSQFGNSLQAVISFLETLTYSYEDGRILFVENSKKDTCKLRFLLLNASSQFSDIVKEARSVIVAGGTMKPTAEFKNRLFINAGADPGRIIEFACDHIIPPENILPIIVTKGSKGEKLLFNFENRTSMGESLKSIILQCCKTVRGGIVVFFPSYGYENWVWQQMKDSNFGREVFREPQNSGSVDTVLEKYAQAIKRFNSFGAILFSVVGGKLSEGLNFSDDLGRCIVVVGLPYANIQSPELKEKINYLNKTEGAGSGQLFYENLCIKSVNQCIGRAVRHKNDYATVLLLDERYNRSTVKNSLPNWIKNSLKVYNYDETFNRIGKFFEIKNQNLNL